MRASAVSTHGAAVRPSFKLRSCTRARRPARATTRPADAADAGEEDFYSLLEVTQGVEISEEQLKSNYRRLQKRFHPDVCGDGGAKSRALNSAYETLSQPDRRADYDRGLLRAGVKRPAPWLSKEGVVGPMQPGELIAAEDLQCAAALPDSLCELALADPEEIVTFVRQWAQTLSYGAEVPLPMPLQNDPVDGGVRVAVIGQAAGTLQSLGELFFIVTSPDDGPGVTVEVRKRMPAGAAAGATLPGEARILKAFKAAMAKLGGRGAGGAGGVQLSGLLAGLAQSAMGMIPFGSTDDDSAYDAYYLRPASKQGSTGDVYLVRERWGVAKSRAMQSMRWGGDYARLRKSLSDAELNAFESKASALMMLGDLQSGSELTATCDSLDALVDELAASTRNV